MIEADKNDDPFLDHGDINYVNKLQKIDTSMNKLIDEIIEAQGDYSTISLMINAYLQNIISERIIGDGETCSTSYSSETGLLTISRIG